MEKPRISANKENYVPTSALSPRYLHIVRALLYKINSVHERSEDMTS